MKITIIGGGTGTSSILRGLKDIPNLEINVIVTMMDDGGSQEVIRKVFGLLPVSDIRKSILALSDTKDEELKRIFEYRFAEGKNLKGHTIGNLVMVALSKILNSEEKAVDEVSKVMRTNGKVIPVTKEMCHLVAEYNDGKIRQGEHAIDEPRNYFNEKILKIYTKPTVEANPRAIDAIKNSDFLICGPGDLYTTTIPNFLVLGIAKAIQDCKGKYIYISNLMTKKGQTRHLTAKGFLSEITAYSGRKPDFTILNNAKIPENILKKYKQVGEKEILDDLKNETDCKIVRDDIIEENEVQKQKGDDLIRSLIRHDSKKTTKILEKIFNEKIY
jgi:uncharacterized cofD-like protein